MKKIMQKSRRRRKNRTAGPYKYYIIKYEKLAFDL
jgi:hypothetical protein